MQKVLQSMKHKSIGKFRSWVVVYRKLTAGAAAKAILLCGVTQSLLFSYFVQCSGDVKAPKPFFCQLPAPSDRSTMDRVDGNCYERERHYWIMLGLRQQH